ncbi:outer membrane protein assembly factor BamB [Luteimonas sp. MC1572]|uniref:outer membrane protein assembly factor BamB n=1 Tax=Luteimonas sp. MC1572 TaxID=2799325 RepID=UPI0018F0BC19|nr:outer membrane protein assembly factor BamB [Luteimonas sp. MC1572]MBJ6980539.1 outer membrane protein assembly factor BamB [Luteimonas sp. MC1572]QQO04411.1 outer membrane protein assembly factor BamB [Luteimonas sp. MC1572]
MTEAQRTSPTRAGSRFATRAATILVCLAVVTGCSTVKGWFGGKGDDAKAGEPAELVKFEATATPTRIWKASAGKGEGSTGVRQGPAVADGRVFAASIKGGVRAFDLQSGAQAWHHASDLRLSGGPGAGDGLVVVGSLDGELVALDAATGAERWTAKVVSEVIAAPTIGQGLVLVRSNEGRVTAFDASNGERRWFWVQDLPSLTVRGNAPVTLGPGHAFVGLDDGRVVALALGDGRVLWEQPISLGDGRTELDRMADVDGAPVLDGPVLFATSYKGRTMAFEAPSGRPIWAAESGGAGGVSVGSDRLVVSDKAGTVWAIDKYVGTSYWRQPALTNRNLGPARIHGSYAVVGDFDGYLHWMRLLDGEFVARERAGRNALAGPPVVADGILVVQDVDGDISAWRID